VAPIQFRSFLYLNVDMLHDYMSSLSPGDLESIVETRRLETNSQPAAQDEMGVEPVKSDEGKVESVRQQTIRLSDRHSFNTLRTAMSDQINVFDEEEMVDFSKTRKSSFIEITREFEISPINEMIDSMLSIAEIARGFGAMQTEEDIRTEKAIHAMSLLFRGDNANPSLPMHAEGLEHGDVNIMFIADRRNLLVPADSFEGEMTLLGSISKVIKEGESRSMFDVFSNVPRALRRSSNVDFKKMMTSMFAQLPDEVGGPIPAEKLELRGPALIVSPLAVFNAGS
jgi:hypothetical protein